LNRLATRLQRVGTPSTLSPPQPLLSEDLFEVQALVIIQMTMRQRSTFPRMEEELNVAVLIARRRFVLPRSTSFGFGFTDGVNDFLSCHADLEFREIDHATFL
jgi:hypothetical protein